MSSPSVVVSSEVKTSVLLLSLCSDKVVKEASIDSEIIVESSWINNHFVVSKSSFLAAQ